MSATVDRKQATDEGHPEGVPVEPAGLVRELATSLRPRERDASFTEAADRDLGLVGQLAHRTADTGVVSLAVVIAAHLDEVDGAPGTRDADLALLARRGLPAPEVAEVRRLLELDEHAPAAAGDENAEVYVDVRRALLGGPAQAPVADDPHAAAGPSQPPTRSRAGDPVALERLDTIYATPEMRATREGRAIFNIYRELAGSRREPAPDRPEENP